MDCLAYGDTVLAERFVAGVEVAVGVLDGPAGPVALPAVEIEPESGIYDHAARYTAGLTVFHTPARPRWPSGPSHGRDEQLARNCWTPDDTGGDR